MLTSIFAALGMPERRVVEGVRYELVRKAGKDRVYNVTFPAAPAMRITATETRQLADLTPIDRVRAAVAASGVLAPGGRVLDFPCGTGAGTNALAEIMGPSGDAIGLDPDAASIEYARRRYPRPNLGYELARTTGHALAGETAGAFDAAFVDAELFRADDKGVQAATLLAVMQRPSVLLVFDDATAAVEQTALRIAAALRTSGIGGTVQPVWSGEHGVLLRAALDPPRVS